MIEIFVPDQLVLAVLSKTKYTFVVGWSREIISTGGQVMRFIDVHAARFAFQYLGKLYILEH